MKKILIASIFALGTAAASAAELGLKTTKDWGATERSSAGFTLSERVAGLNAQVGVERFARGNVDQTRYELTASHNLFSVMGVTVAARAGGAWLDNQSGNDGLAAVAGLGFSLPVTKSMTLGVDAVRQIGQDRVSAFDGNLVSIGMRVKF